MPQASRHVHLDPVGGIAGDMFVAALIDLCPEAEDDVRSALAALGLPRSVAFGSIAGLVSGLHARLFTVDVGAAAPPTGAYPAIVERIEAATLPQGTKERALDIFARLAAAEAQVHGVPVEKVHFHEIADWDSIVDIVAAATLIDRFAGASWSCGPLPRGGGLVRTQHGLLPVPAPATLAVAKGLRWHDDGVTGERVTPTGAAIVSHLLAHNPPGRQCLDGRPAVIPEGSVLGSGYGAGSKTFPNLPNVVRATLYDTASHGADRVAVISFEIDDMTGEELAVAMDRLRSMSGVLDVGMAQSIGKKGRPRCDMRILAEPGALAAVGDACFEETSTLGFRHRIESRRVVERWPVTTGDAGGHVRAKAARRPSGVRTVKAESDDLAGHAGLAARREIARRTEASACGETADE
jgi:uncharacterized protein (TIGR00299 family) protein